MCITADNEGLLANHKICNDHSCTFLWLQRSPSCSSNNLATAILIAISSNYVVSRKLADHSNLTTIGLSYVYQNQHAENTFTFILKLLSCINCLISVLVLILVY